MGGTEKGRGRRGAMTSAGAPLTLLVLVMMLCPSVDGPQGYASGSGGAAGPVAGGEGVHGDGAGKAKEGAAIGTDGPGVTRGVKDTLERVSGGPRTEGRDGNGSAVSRRPIWSSAAGGVESPTPEGPDTGPAVEAGSADVIHFAAAADQHYGWNGNTVPDLEAATVNDWMYHPDLPEFDFMVPSVGDWVSDNRAGGAWQDPETVWSAIASTSINRQLIPYFWVTGNHDTVNYEYMPDANPVRKERTGRALTGMNENNYAFMYKNVLFICAAQTNNLFELSAFQRSWMELLLDRYHDHTTVIMAHQAINRTTGQGDDRASSWDTNDYKVHNRIQWWRALFDDNPQVKLYIHGHTEKGADTIFHDGHSASWDDECAFVLVPSNGRGSFDPDQQAWSYVFSISDDAIQVRLWNSEKHKFKSNLQQELNVPFNRTGMSNNVTGSGMEWYSVPKQVQDGLNWTWRNHFVAERYELELVGTNVTEHLDNPELDGCFESDEDRGSLKEAYWYAVHGDKDALNLATGEEDGFIMVGGNRTIELATDGTSERKTMEGNVPYNTAVAVPGASYTFSCFVNTSGGTGSVDVMMGIPAHLNLSRWIWDGHVLLSNVSVGQSGKAISKTFTVPQNDTVWFLKPLVHFDPGAVYLLHNWSLRRVAEPGAGNATRNLTVRLNGEGYGCEGFLSPGDGRSFTLANRSMSNVMEFNCSIDGNRVRMARLVYRRPLLWSDDVSIGVRTESQSMVDLVDVSPYNNRTTIMSFSDTGPGLDGFDRALVRGKNVFLKDASNRSLNGRYALYDIPDSVRPELGPDLTPSPATTGDTLTLAINITDYFGVDRARAEFRFGGGAHRNWSMNRSAPGSDTFTLDIPVPANSTANASYVFRAADGADNWNCTPAAQRSVVDDDPPAFAEDNTPASAISGTTVRFEVLVYDNVAVANVTLVYRQGAGGSSNVTMSGGNPFVAELALPADSTEDVRYHFRCYDTAGNLRESVERIMTVWLTGYPEFGPDNSDMLATTGERFRFRINVTDNTGVQEVTVEYRLGGGSPVNATMDGAGNGTHSLSVDIPANSTPRLRYSFHAVDPEGHWAESSGRWRQVVDNDPPVLQADSCANVSTTGDPFRFRASFSDNVGVEEARVEYAFTGGDTVNSTMSPESGGWYSLAAAAPPGRTGMLVYRLMANDSAGCWVKGGWTEVPLVDDDPPNILHDGTLSIATTGDEFTFLAQVNDNIAVDSVGVRYSFNGGDDVFAEMTGYDGYTRSVKVPPWAAGGMTYVLSATDTSGNVNRTAPRTVTVLDDDPPVLGEDRSDGEATTGGVLHFRVNCSDNSALDGVRVKYWFTGDVVYQTIMRELPGGSGAHVCGMHIPRNASGRLYYRFIARDEGGNEASTGVFSMDVADDDGPLLGPDMATGRATTGDKYTFRLMAVDNLKVKKVWVSWRVGDGEPANTTMDRESKGLYNATVWLPQGRAGDLTYAYGARDPGGNVHRSAVVSVPVTDDDPPVLLADLTPGKCDCGETLVLAADAWDNIGMEGVILRYAFGSGPVPDAVTEVAMRDAGNDRWSFGVDVPEGFAGRIHYRFILTDVSGNRAAMPWESTRVRDVLFPSLVNDLSPATATTGDPHTWTVVVSDNFGVSYVRLRYWFDIASPFTADMVMQKVDTYTFTAGMPHGPGEPVGYEFVISDLSGNVITVPGGEVALTDDDPPRLLEDLTRAETSTGSAFHFAAIITDNAVVLDARVEYWFGRGMHREEPMESGDILTAAIDIPENAPPSLRYRFIARDGTGNDMTGTTRVVDVRDVLMPEAQMKVAKSARPGEELVLDGTASSDNRGIVSHEWTVLGPDSGVAALTGPRPSHVFEQAGDHTVTLKVTDGDGNVDVASVAVGVEGAVLAPPVLVSIGPVVDDEGEPVSGVAVAIEAAGVIYHGYTGPDGMALVEVPSGVLDGQLNLSLHKAGYYESSFDLRSGSDGISGPTPMMLEALPEPDEGGGRRDDTAWGMVLVVMLFVVSVLRLYALARWPDGLPVPPGQGPDGGMTAPLKGKKRPAGRKRAAGPAPKGKGAGPPRQERKM